MKKRKRNHQVVNNFDNNTFESHLKLFKNSKTNILHSFNLKEIEPKTENQEKTLRNFYDGRNLLLHGSAGTGKTFLSMYLGLDHITNKSKYNKLCIVRSVVPTREVGHLPGDLDKKIEVYEMPYKSIVNELLMRGDAYEILKKKRLIEFLSTSFVRGITFDNAIILVDEIQNLSFHELDSIMTRVGNNCRIIFSGDFKQSDLKNVRERQGLHNFMEILSGMKNFEKIDFSQNDIVRSELVKNYIIQKENLNFY